MIEPVPGFLYEVLLLKSPYIHRTVINGKSHLHVGTEAVKKVSPLAHKGLLFAFGSRVVVDVKELETPRVSAVICLYQVVPFMDAADRDRILYRLNALRHHLSLLFYLHLSPLLLPALQAHIPKCPQTLLFRTKSSPLPSFPHSR